MAYPIEFFSHTGKLIQNATSGALDKVADFIGDIPGYAASVAKAHNKWGQIVEQKSEQHWDSWGRNAAITAAASYFGPKVAATFSNMAQPGPGQQYRWQQNLITPTFARSLGYQAARTAASAARFNARRAWVPRPRPARAPFIKYRYQGAGFGGKPKWKQNYHQQRKNRRKFKGKF